MANTSSAQKAARQNEKRRFKNIARKTAIKTAVKKVLAAIEAKDFNGDQARELLRDVAAKLSRAKSKHVIHANTASRKLSRLTKRLDNRTQAA